MFIYWCDNFRRKFKASKWFRYLIYFSSTVFWIWSYNTWLPPTTLYIMEYLGTFICYSTWTTGAFAIIYYLLCPPHLYPKERPKFPLFLTTLYHMNNLNITLTIIFCCMYGFFGCLPQFESCSECLFFFIIYQVIFATYYCWFVDWECYSLEIRQYKRCCYILALLYIPAIYILYAATWKNIIINIISCFF